MPPGASANPVADDEHIAIGAILESLVVRAIPGERLPSERALALQPGVPRSLIRRELQGSWSPVSWSRSPRRAARWRTVPNLTTADRTATPAPTSQLTVERGKR